MLTVMLYWHMHSHICFSGSGDGEVDFEASGAGREMLVVIGIEDILSVGLYIHAPKNMFVVRLLPSHQAEVAQSR